MLDIDKIRQLVEMMVSNDLIEISLRDGEEEVNLRRPNAAGGDVGTAPAAPTVSANPGSNPAGPAVDTPTSEAPGESDESDLVEINAPMVGTFYAAPDPETPAFVRVGQSLSASTVVCILEAMKVFNEIKAGVAGTLERVLVKNAQPVEFGQPLFLVRPH